MDEFKFRSLEELYRKLLPAFRVKINDLRRNNISSISNEDIWNYLKINKWSNRTNLSLDEMVNDIITLSEIDITNYVISRNKG